jgi:molybdate transport system substrate-binding protein
VQAQQVSAAVAANFAGAIKQLKPAFEAETGHRLVTSLASTGTLYAQIYNGAPFDVFLSADNKRPQQLVADGLAINGSVFTYALGRLTLWSNDPTLIDAQGSVLREEEWDKKGIKRIARANPKTAPYGTAAMETLAALNISEAMKGRLITGQNVAQAFQFIVSGNAQLGFIAQSQVLTLAEHNRGSHWLVPANLYSPIEQSAVLLIRGQENNAALAFLNFLKSPKASAIIKSSGYNTPNN